MKLTRAQLNVTDLVAYDNDDGEPAHIPGIVVSTDLDEPEVVLIAWYCSDDVAIEEVRAGWLRRL